MSLLLGSARLPAASVLSSQIQPSLRRTSPRWTSAPALVLPSRWTAWSSAAGGARCGLGACAAAASATRSHGHPQRLPVAGPYVEGKGLRVCGICEWF